MKPELAVFWIIILVLAVFFCITYFTRGPLALEPEPARRIVLILDRRVDYTLYNTPVYILEYMPTDTLEYRYADFRSEEQMAAFIDRLAELAELEWLGVAK